MNLETSTPQETLPLALVFGQPVTEMPQDLYIPPDALRILLESFEGPLDLLLYLIRRQNFDILNIPMAQVTTQYMTYVSAMQAKQLELAAEYLLMAAMLIEIKSRLLLPKPVSAEENDDSDPRAELVRRLLEYERMKLAAQELNALPLAERDFSWVTVWMEYETQVRLPDVTPIDLGNVWRQLLAQASNTRSHTVRPDELSVREQMSDILRRLGQAQRRGSDYIEFSDLFDTQRGVPLLVVSFIAVLELTRERMVEVTQAEPYALIYVRLAAIGA